MSALVKVTAPISYEHLLLLASRLDARSREWGILNCTVDHVNAWVSFVLFLPGAWHAMDDLFFADLLQQGLLVQSHELVSLNDYPISMQSQSVKNAFQDLLAGLLIFFGDGGIHEATCLCERKATHQGVCPYCWSRNMYEVYRFAVAHLR